MAVSLIDEQLADVSARVPCLQREAALTPEEQQELAALEVREFDQIAATSED